MKKNIKKSFSIFILIITLWIFCCFHTPLVSAQCLDDQKSLLLDLKHNLTFSEYASDKLEGWNQSTDCCMWSGVECDNSNGRVIGLDLSWKHINGDIDNSCSLFRLCFLQRLNLAGNWMMGGKIPSAIGNLSSLTYLNLSHTGFTGQVPIEISKLVKLIVLDISFVVDERHSSPYMRSTSTSTSLFMKKPNLAAIIQKMSNMRELYLDGVNNSAMGNKWCQALSSSLPQLQVLSMSNCRLRGKIHKSLSNLHQHLSVINLDDNSDMDGPFPEFLADFTNLTSLSLPSLSLVGIVPGKFFQIPTLRYLDLSANFYLQGSLPSSIGNLKKLRTLDLSDCSFNGSIPSAMEGLNLLEEVNLSNNKFSGSIPSFSSMKNLNFLDLQNNSLSGSINGTNWGKLINLMELRLSYNSLDGSIPKSLFSNPSLETVDFESNKFSGVDEFGSMPFSQIRELVLRNNSLEGSIPNSIFQLRKLETLDLYSNSLTGLVPLKNYQLGKLKYIDLSSNRLNGTLKLVEFLLNFKNLSELDLSFNFLSIDLDGCNVNSSFPQLAVLNLASCNLRAIPKFLKNQTDLYRLDLSMNNISGIVPEWMWRIGYLNLSSNYLFHLEKPSNLSLSFCSSLDIHSNFLHGKFPIVSSSLSYLDCSNNNFTSIDPEFSNYISYAEFLSFSNNKLAGSIPLMLCNASSIQLLNLEHNHFSGKIPDCLIQNTKLSVLNLRGNKQLSGVIPDKFSSKCTLESLYLNDNTLQGRIPHSLANCKELKVLDVGDNLMNDTFPCRLKILSKLQVLILRSNKLHGQIVCSGNHSDWKMLQVVDLAFNHFSGEITSDILLKWTSMRVGANKLKRETSLHDNQTIHGNYYTNSVTLTFKGNEYVFQNNLAIFVSIDFSNNDFHGELPREIGNLNALVVLNLSHNSFSGSIPSSIGNLSQIESFDISWNNFSGHIPTELAKLNFLSYLNMSFNMLWGKIPTSTQLQSFDASSFKGNRGLFGPPLTPFSRGEPGTSSFTSGSSSEGSNWSSKSTLDWLWMGAEVGFPVGITIFIGPLLYIRRWRQWYCRLLYKLVIKILRKEDHARGRRNRRTGRQRQRH